MSNLSYVAYTGDGVTNQFLLSVDGGEIGYLRTEDIHVYVDDVEVTFNIETASPHLVILDAAPASGSEIVLRREMPQGTTYSDFSRGNKFGPKNMNNSFQQGLYLTQEILDGYLPEGSTQKQDLNFGGKHSPTNLRAPVAPSDATNKEYVDARDTEQRARLTSLETAHVVSSANDMLSYTYNGGSAVGGELTFSVGIPFESVNRLYINGVHQTYGLAWDYDTSLQIVELAEELDAEDEVVVELGVDAQKILDNEVVNSNATVVSDMTNRPLRLATIAMNSAPIDAIWKLRTYIPEAPWQSVEVLGHTLAGIGGGQFYYYPDDTTSADNNGTVIVTSGGHRWKRKMDGFVTPEMFGALGDGVSDDTQALQAALLSASLRTLKVPTRTYIVSDTLEVPHNSAMVGDAAYPIIDFVGGDVPVINLNMRSCVSNLEVKIRKPDYSGTGINYLGTTSIAEAAEYDTIGFRYQKALTLSLKDIRILKLGNNPSFETTRSEQLAHVQGNAVTISTNGVEELPYLWGISIKNVEVSGAFDKGIYVVNEGSWNHDAVIGGCTIVDTRYPIYLDNVGSSRITDCEVQPHTLSDGSTKYAREPVTLKDCYELRIDNNRFWDSQHSLTNTLLAMLGNTRHIHLDVCAKLIEWASTDSSFKLFTFEQGISKRSLSISVLGEQLAGEDGSTLRYSAVGAFNDRAARGILPTSIGRTTWKSLPIPQSSNNSLVQVGYFHLTIKDDATINAFAPELRNAVTIFESSDSSGKNTGIVGTTTICIRDDGLPHMKRAVFSERDDFDKFPDYRYKMDTTPEGESICRVYKIWLYGEGQGYPIMDFNCVPHGGFEAHIDRSEYFTSGNYDLLNYPEVTSSTTGDSYTQNARYKTISSIKANKSSLAYSGMEYFASDLGKPVWWDGTNWVDATGTIL